MEGQVLPVHLPLTRCICTFRARLHLKDILHHWRESSVLMTWGCPSRSAVFGGRIRTLLPHVQSGEVAAPHSRWHQHSCSSAVCGRPTWQLPRLTSDEHWHGQAGRRAGQILHPAARAPKPPRDRAPCKEQAHLPRTCPRVSDEQRHVFPRASGEPAGLGSAARQG